MNAIVFDLDYTLYDADLFYRGAFRDVAQSLALRYERDGGVLLTSLVEHWQRLTGRHLHLFDEFLAHNDLPDREMPQCVKLLHRHRGNLALYPDARRLLEALPDTVPVGIVTDGNAMMQRNKVAALGLVGRFDAICFTADGGHAWHKPSPLPFQAVLRRLDVPAHQAIYVGDNPRTDARGALMAGMRPIRLRRGPFASEDPEEQLFHRDVTSLDELLVELRLPSGPARGAMGI